MVRQRSSLLTKRFKDADLRLEKTEKAVKREIKWKAQLGDEKKEMYAKIREDI